MPHVPFSTLSISRLQFSLSRTLANCTADNCPFWISNRGLQTHLVLPLTLVSEELLALLTCPE